MRFFAACSKIQLSHQANLRRESYTIQLRIESIFVFVSVCIYDCVGMYGCLYVLIAFTLKLPNQIRYNRLHSEEETSRQCAIEFNRASLLRTKVME